MRYFKRVKTVGMDTIYEFLEDGPFQLAAALSYYTLLSIAPLLLVVTGVAGVLLGEAPVRDALINQVRELIGDEGATFIRTVLENVGGPTQGWLSVAIGLILVLIGASTVFAQLQVALNRIWRVQTVASNALTDFIRRRLVSLAIVLGIGVLFWVSLAANALLQTAYGSMAPFLPAVLLSAVNPVMSFGMGTLLIAIMFKYVPDAHIAWRDTWIGAACTAALFTLGTYIIGLYFGRVSVGSAYGAASSAVVFMVWIYYASLILFFGAELTKVLARHQGRPLSPSRYARAISMVG